MIIGSLFPDIMDKSILFLSIASGRGYFHTLLSVFLCTAILFGITRGNKPITFSFFTGVIFHLILDLPNIPMFYPFIAYDITKVYNPINDWYNTLLTDPIVQITESIAIGIFIFIVFNNKLYKREEIFNFLRTSPVFIGIIETKADMIIVEDN